MCVEAPSGTAVPTAGGGFVFLLGIWGAVLQGAQFCREGFFFYAAVLVQEYIYIYIFFQLMFFRFVGSSYLSACLLFCVGFE